MEEYIQQLTLIYHTLTTLTITATKPNVSALLGCLQALEKLISELQAKEAGK